MIGEGGMGAVYEAEHIALGAVVAVKLLSDGAVLDPSAVTRFRREAKAMGAVRHDNVVAVMDADTDEDGTPFLVMERLDGESLSAVLRREKRLTASTACGISSQLLAGLAAAHQKGIIHRDLKPGNIFIARQSDGTKRVKILDFGVSKLGDATETLNVTADGVLIGTPNFMAPEQIEGRSDVDGRADIYAAGVILYRAVTGHLPYAAASSDELYKKVLCGEMKPPRERRADISPELESVILKAMACNPAHRYQDASEFRASLTQANPQFSIQGIFVSTSTNLAAPRLSDTSSRTPTVELTEPPTRLERPSAKSAAADAPRPASRRRFVWASGFSLAMVSALWLLFAGGQGDASGPPLRVGVIQYLPAEVVAARHAPMISYLSDRLNRKVELVVAQDHDELVEMFLANKVGIAALSPYNYVRTRRRDARLHLLAAPVLGGGASAYEGLILTRKQAEISHLRDLRDKVFCFVDPGSSSGYLYPRAILRDAGIDPESDFKAVRFGGNHLTTLRLLARGHCDAAAVFASILYDAEKHNMRPQSFRVLASTDRIPLDAYCASSSFSDEEAQAVRSALLSLAPESEQAIAVFGRTTSWFSGFEAVEDADYDAVRGVADDAAAASERRAEAPLPSSP